MEILWCVTAMELACFSHAMNITKDVHPDLCLATEFPCDLEKKEILEFLMFKLIGMEISFSSLICSFLLDCELWQNKLYYTVVHCIMIRVSDRALSVAILYNFQLSNHSCFSVTFHAGRL